jgi:putative transposase
LLKLSRAEFYRGLKPRRIPPEQALLIRRIDALHLEHPHAGSRHLRDLLRKEGIRVGRERIRRLMRRMGLVAVAPKPNTSKRTPGHKIYPYRLRGVTIDRVNQVWSTDITYVPMPRGHLYLVAIMDWHSRKVLSWRVSNSMDSRFCVEALKEALARFGKPEIFNTDQGSQFTSEAFTGILLEHGVSISMDGKGRATDNAFIERLWRSVKYENIYLYGYSDRFTLTRGLDKYFRWFNQGRPHQSLDGQAPDEVYFAHSNTFKRAA